MKKVRAKDVKVGDVLEDLGRVDMVEDIGHGHVQIGYEAHDGNWGDFPEDQEMVLLE